MVFVKILHFLLFHAALPNNMWHIYVDFELFKVLELHCGKTNMISAIIQTDKVDISCPLIVQHAAIKRQDKREVRLFNFPCAFMDAVIPVTYDAQPKRLWTITCPDKLWIELSIITLELPFSGPQCTDGHVAFMNLLGEPADVKYCGRKPQEKLYASARLMILQNIQKLRSELRMNMKYQYITKPSYQFHQRVPYMFREYNDFWIDFYMNPHFFLMEIPYHSIDMMDTVRYRILYIPNLPNDLQMIAFKIVIYALECNYVVYDGPGIYSPQIGSSSTNGTIYSKRCVHAMYIEFYGSMKLCQPVRIDYLYRSDSYFRMQSIDPIKAQHGENNHPIHCSNSIYVRVGTNVEFDVQSSEEHNVWCRIDIDSEHTWNFMLEMEYDGPQILFQDVGQSSCQFGGVYVLENDESHAYCESVSVQSNNYYSTRYVRTVFIQFYSGYSSGRVKLKILKTDFEQSSLNWGKAMCLNEICTGNRHIWAERSVRIGPDFSIMDDPKYSFFDVYPNQFSYFITEPIDIKHIHVHITAGKEDGSTMLGLVHFVLSLQCSGQSICSTEFVIGASMLAHNFTQDTYVYNNSVTIDERVGYARLLSLSINVSHVEEVELKVMFEKVQHCNHHSPDVYAQQVPYHGCDFMKVKNIFGYAHFLPQLMQGFTIGLDPACPVKECIDLNVKLTPICACTGQLEWTKTALEHVPVIINTSYDAITSLTWTQSAQCSANFQSVQHLCDVWIKVDFHSVAGAVGIHPQILHYDEYLTVPISQSTYQMYVYKM